MYRCNFSVPACFFLDGLIQGAASNLNTGMSVLAEMRNTDKTNQINKDIAAENLAFQRENLDYQKALQQQIFEREDTAYQRTVDDMRAAGLSPLSMQSTNGAGEAIATEALHNDYHHEKYDLSALSQLNDALNNAIDVNMRRDELRQKEQYNQALINLTNAQAAEKWNQAGWVNRLSEQQFKQFVLQNEGYDWQNKKEFAYSPFWSLNAENESKMLKASLSNLGLDGVYKQIQNIIAGFQANDWGRQDTYNGKYNINSGMSEKERLGSIGIIEGTKVLDNLKALGASMVDSDSSNPVSDFMNNLLPGDQSDEHLKKVVDQFNERMKTNYTLDDYKSNKELRADMDYLFANGVTAYRNRVKNRK